MRWRAARVLAAALVAGVLTAGCATGAGGEERARLGDIDPRNFVYRGACGGDQPSPDTALVRGRQPATSGPGTEVVSRAQLVTSRTVRLGTPARDYRLVRLQCSLGARTTTGWHLLGLEGDRPVDLGIVAASAGPIELAVEDGQLVVEHGYRRSTDEGLSDTGHTRYRVAVSGLTPVRLYADQQPEDIPAPVAEWAADDWRAGLVTLTAPVPGAPPSVHLGVQVDAATVLTADTLASGPLGCRPVVVGTSTGQRIESAATEGWTDRAGSRITLALPTDTPELSRVGPFEGLGAPVHGLLVPASGLVPALATAVPSGDGAVRVESAAPADVQWFEAGTGGPAAVLRDATGVAVLAGRWPGVMPALPDQDTPTDVRCGRA